MDIAEVQVAQFAQTLREYGGAIQAALADVEIEEVPPELHPYWEAILEGIEHLRPIEGAIDKWMGPYRAQRGGRLDFNTTATVQRDAERLIRLTRRAQADARAIER